MTNAGTAIRKAIGPTNAETVEDVAKEEAGEEAAQETAEADLRKCKQQTV